MTADEFLAQYGDHPMELDRGQLEVLPIPDAQHGRTCAAVGNRIADHVQQRGLGHVLSNDAFLQTRTDPDSVRGVDVLFLSYDHLPRGPVPAGLLRIAPDLVVEVRSPSHRWSRLLIKANEYLNLGVRLVVVLDMVTATVSLFRDQDPWQQTLDNGDMLDLGEVLPGFIVPVRQLFAV